MKLLVASIGLLFFPLVAAAQPTPPPPRIHIVGRTVGDASGTRFGWPGVYFEKRIRATGVWVDVEADTDHLRLLVDGVEKAVLTKPGHAHLRITGLAPGEHLVRLEKLTENQSGSARFLSLEAIDGDDVMPPPRRARQIEFIGDSHSVGYGDTSPVRECTRDEVHDTTNTQLAFGPVLARRLDADYQVNAYSGFGIVRNYAGSSPGQSLPTIYPRAIPGEAAPANRDRDWRPQVVVINLGTNDFSTPLKPGEPWADDAALRKAYRDAYVAFVRELDGNHYDTRFVLMGADNFYGEVEAVAKTLGLGPRLVTVHVPPLELTGCDWHPSLKDHRLMADLVAEGLRKLRLYMD